MASLAQQYSGLRCSPLSSSHLSKPQKSVSFPIVSAVAIAGSAETRERHMFEEAYERCRTAPTEGGIEDFHNALDKYDFNSETGTKKKVQEDGRVLQESAEEKEDNLCLHMENDLNLKQFPRRNALALMLSSFIFLQDGSYVNALPQASVGLREYIDSFDGYSFKYPKNWIQVRGAGADIFFRDPFVLDENLSVDISSPSSSNFKSIEDLGPPQVAGERMLKQYLTEFMSTRLGVRRESSIQSTSSRVADDGKMYYVVEVNIKSYANNNELAVMPQDRVARLEWDRRYFSVLGVENKQLYELRLQTPENVFLEEERDLRQVMDSFRVFKVSV